MIFEIKVPAPSQLYNEDNFLNWVREYVALIDKPIPGYVFCLCTDEKNHKKLIDYRCDISIYISSDDWDFLNPEEAIFVIWINFENFKYIYGRNKFRMFFRFYPENVEICGDIRINSNHFADEQAVKLNLFLKERFNIENDFDFNFEIKTTYEDALVKFKNAFCEEFNNNIQNAED